MKKRDCLTVLNFTAKFILLLVFSSDYKDKLFVPFLDLFSANLLGNPWQTVFAAKLPFEFPYPPLTLWVVAAFYVPFKWMGLERVGYAIPLLLGDYLIYRSLCEIRPNQKQKIQVHYLFSPIMIFVTYIHSQLDVISIAFITVGLLYVQKKKYWLAILFAALATISKSQIVAILPLLAIFFWRNRQRWQAAAVILFPFLLHLVVASPYVMSAGYQSLVLNNPKQNQIFDSYFLIQDSRVFVPILVVLILYGRFLGYRRVNFDLLMNFAGITFAIFLLSVKPSPGWYVWVVPCLVLLLVNQKWPIRAYIAHMGLGAVFLVYFLCFHKFDHHPINFLNIPVHLYCHQQLMGNLAFTCLFASMLSVVFVFYRTGIQSNEVYQRLQGFAIGIGGDSGSGKSSLLSDLKSIFGRNLVELEGDGEHRWERGDANWIQMTHLDPKANRLHDQARTILRLKDGRPVYRRDYDHEAGTFTKPVRLEPAEFVLISGLHPFYLPVMRNLLDLKIFLNPDESLWRHWKIVRDTTERGHSREHVLEQIEQRREDRQRFIQPQLEYADLVFRFRPQGPFEIGDPSASPDIRLEVFLDASVPLEEVVEDLARSGQVVSWDYSGNLRQQILTVQGGSPRVDYRLLAVRHVANAQELVDLDRFASGHRGLMQFLTLFVIGDRLRSDRVGTED